MNAPNILLIVSDQERQRDWLPSGLELPARQRLIDEGLEFSNYYTHTSPCSPSRATLFTGEYMAAHGVTENSIGPDNTQLRKDAVTLGHLLRERGYYTGYKGKWHLESTATPDMEAYGFSDWEGNDMSFWGLAGSGTEFDEPIARSSAEWIRSRKGTDQPWFLAVGLVNPHDIMWFPVDQPWYWEQDPEYVAQARERMSRRDWGRDDNLPGFPFDLDEWFTELPPNFDDDLHTKPEVHRRWMAVMTRRSSPGVMERDDPAIWLRQLDYYAKLHELNDRCVGQIFSVLDEMDSWDDTIVVFTSDHGDQCGSHQLRSKGPWNYQETMRIPLYIRAPGLTQPGSKYSGLACHVDLARTIAEFGGVNVNGVPTMTGESLHPVFEDPSTTVRDHVLFAQEWAWYPGVEQCRYASSGIFDGRYKYCRYYGIGGSHDTLGNQVGEPEMLFGRDSDFEDHDHELYDLQEDPYELVNLAVDRSRRTEVRSRFGELRALEHQVYGDGY
ncbi:MAG: sulfatase-like hydrolase/transferase [Actinomycetota bacterium]|nr:sulfatase-like hydrolase/transferase [Actinomycetota bacterium]